MADTNTYQDVDANTYKDIICVLQGYFDGLYHADSKMLSEVFHPDARYVNMMAGDYMNYSINEYFEIVDQRTPPASAKGDRKDQILSIEFSGQNMAFAKAKMSMMGRVYLDFLTLTFDETGWRIMSKIFTYTSKKEEI